MGSDSSPRFGACSFNQNHGRGKRQWFPICVLNVWVVVISIFFFPGVYWKQQLSVLLVEHQERKAKKGKVVWLCTGSCWSLGCQGVAPGAGTCWALLPVHGCVGQWPRPGQWIRARTRPAISVGKWATCPASSHLKGLFLSGKGYEICSFFSGTSCPLEILEGWGEVCAASGTFLWEPRSGIFTQHLMP